MDGSETVISVRSFETNKIRLSISEHPSESNPISRYGMVSDGEAVGCSTLVLLNPEEGVHKNDTADTELPPITADSP